MSGNVENLYVDEEPKTIEVEDVEIKIRELSGFDYTDIIDELDVQPGTQEALENTKYMKLLLKKCVVEPELDLDRLKVNVMNKIATEVQQGLNIDTEVDNLNLK